MAYRISGLAPEPFAPLAGLDDAALAAANARRYVADAQPGFPCRITLEDAAPGERLLLVNFEHLAGDTPYRASHAIFVREGARHVAVFDDAVPPMLATRLLSVRAYDTSRLMCNAEVVDGRTLEDLIERMWADPQVAFLQAHSAARGCYLAQITRC